MRALLRIEKRSGGLQMAFFCASGAHDFSAPPLSGKPLAGTPIVRSAPALKIRHFRSTGTISGGFEKNKLRLNRLAA
jgi:hypothetical protein